MTNFISLNLKSVGQVMFQGSPITGLLFLVGISFAAYVGNSIELILSTVLCTIFANLAAVFFKASSKLINDGLYGYNGTLIGIAGAVFFEASWTMYGLVILGTLFSVFLIFIALEKMPERLKFPVLTFPFVFIFWILLLIVDFYFLDLKRTTPFATDHYMMSSFFKSISQVFVLENSITGGLFLFGIFINSISSGVFAAAGGGFAVLVGILFKIDTNLIAHGIFGYNAVLTSIALGSVFLSFKKDAVIFAIVGICLTLVYQLVLSACFTGIGLPVLTAPFVFAVWTMLLVRKLIYSLGRSKPLV